MPRDDDPEPEAEIDVIFVLSELEEHEDELAQLLNEVRESRKRLSALVRSMQSRLSAKGSKTRPVH